MGDVIAMPPDREWKDHRERLLITPRRLGQIGKEVRETKAWSGYSRGYKMRITLEDQISLAGERMTWEIRLIDKTWVRGKAGTVFDCIRSMEAAAAK